MFKTHFQASLSDNNRIEKIAIRTSQKCAEKIEKCTVKLSANDKKPHQGLLSGEVFSCFHINSV